MPSGRLRAAARLAPPTPQPSRVRARLPALLWLFFALTSAAQSQTANPSIDTPTRQTQNCPVAPTACPEQPQSPEDPTTDLQPTEPSPDLAPTPIQLDGLTITEAFTSQPLGSGVDPPADTATDTPPDPSAGPGTAPRSVEDGGHRAGAAFVFSQAAVREFRTDRQGDAAGFGTALYGHSIGGVVPSLSRSGEPGFHGMALYSARSSAWAAADPYSIASTYSNGVSASGVVKPGDLRQQFAARVGGPLFWPVPPARSPSDYLPWNHPQPRLFFLYAFDTTRRAFPAISSPGNPNFYLLTATQTALLASRGVSTSATTAALNYLASLTGPVDRHASQTTNFLRLDVQRTPRERLIAEYNRASWSNPAGARTTSVIPRGRSSFGSSYGSADIAILRWLRSPSPRLSTELRLQYAHELQYETPQTPLPQEPAIGPGGLPPEVSIGPEGLAFGTPASLGQRAYPDETRVEAAGIATWTHTTHIVQFGVDLSLIRDFTNSLTNSEGTFSYDSGFTNGHAGGLVDWITDYTFGVHAYPNGACPSIYASVHYFCFRSYSQSFGQQSARFATQDWAAFLQDQWRASTTLTLHAGLRYEYQLLPVPQHPSAALDSVFAANGATSVFPEDRNNFGPHLGLDWQPFGRGAGTFRLGYGVLFGRVPGATIQAALLDTATAASVSRIRIVPTTEALCPQNTIVGFGYPCSFLAAPSGVVAATTSAVVFDRRFRLPMIQQGTLSLERILPGGLLVQAEAVSNIDRQLPGSTDINIAPSTSQKAYILQNVSGRPNLVEGETFHIPLYTARINPSFGPVTDIVSRANATSNALTLALHRGFGAAHDDGPRNSPRLQFNLRWTWSKAIDFAPSSSSTPRANGQFDPFTNGYDKALSTFNRPHRTTLTAVLNPRLEQLAGASRHPALRSAAAGWSLQTVAEQISGRPYSYEIFGGTRLSGGRESINGSGGSTVLPTLGRNTLRLPDTFTTNLRLTREFARHTSGPRLLAAIQASNLTNHLNIAGVQQRAFLAGTAVNGVTPLVFQNAAAIASEGLTTQPFGTYTSSATGSNSKREIELSLRLFF